VVKATGDGLSVRLPGVIVSPPGSAPALLSYEGRAGLAGSTRLAPLHPGTGYLASVAVIGDRPVSLTEFDAEALLPLA
jgi:4'-phosphopantetheinyl transferase